MEKKTDLVRRSIAERDIKTALRIAKSFKLGVSGEQREVMGRAYECIVHPEFYRQIGVDVTEAVRKGEAVVVSLYGA